MFEAPLCMAFLGRCLISSLSCSFSCECMCTDHMMERIPLPLWYQIYGELIQGKTHVCNGLIQQGDLETLLEAVAFTPGQSEGVCCTSYWWPIKHYKVAFWWFTAPSACSAGAHGDAQQFAHVWRGGCCYHFTSIKKNTSSVLYNFFKEHTWLFCVMWQHMVQEIVMVFRLYSLHVTDICIILIFHMLQLVVFYFRSNFKGDAASLNFPAWCFLAKTRHFIPYCDDFILCCNWHHIAIYLGIICVDIIWAYSSVNFRVNFLADNVHYHPGEEWICIFSLCVCFCCFC